MSGAFSVGGLISGLDSKTLIAQLVQLDKAPITNLQKQISTFETQRTAIRGLRTQLQTLRNSIQDFRLNNTFNQYLTPSSDEDVATAAASGTSPVMGSYRLNVTQLASATTAASNAKLGSAANPDASLSSSGITTSVTAGTFTINGVQLTIADPNSQSLNSILAQINSSAAGVTASYDSATDTVKFQNTTVGSAAIINFGATGDTSNFLTALNVRLATQSSDSNGTTTLSSTHNLGAVDPAKRLNQAAFVGGAITAGTFQVNGVSITVDPTTDALADVVQRINASDAQVLASYDSSTDRIRVVSKTLGSRTVSFTAGTSNFLSVTNLTSAVQTAGNDAQFTVNGGPVQTRNSNEVADAIGDVTLRLKSTGTTTVTISGNDDKIVEDVQAFVKAFNDSLDNIASLTGEEGALRNDSSMQEIASTLNGTIFSTVSGLSGTYSSLVDIGLSTGDTFDSKSTAHLQLDADKLKEALRTNRTNVQSLFNNDAKNGVGDTLFTYLDSITKSTGFLNDRVKTNGSIDAQIKSLNDRIDKINERATMHETQLKKQFTQLEVMSAKYQSQATAISKLGSL